MASEAEKIIRHGWLFMVANVVNRAAGLLLLPLYTKVLTPAEFGVYALIGVVGDILAVMLMIGMINAFTVVYFDHADEAGRRRVVATTMLGLWGATVGLLALAWPAGWLVSRMLFGGGQQAMVVAIAFAGIAFTAVFELALAYYRVHKRSGICLAISVAKAVALLVLNLVFVWGMEMGVKGIFLANSLTFVAIALVLTVAILRANRGAEDAGFSFAILRRIAALGLPFLPQTLLDIGNQFANRYLVNLMIGVAAVGVLSFGLRLATLLYMFLTASFLQIWSVSRIEARHGAADREQAEFVFSLFVILLAAAALGMALVTPEILWLIASQDYAPVLGCMPFLVLSYVLHGVRMHPEVALVKTKRVLVLPLISLGGLAVGIGATAALIGPLGVAGAALGVLARELFMLVATELTSRRLCPGELPLNVGQVLGVLVPVALAYVAGQELFGAAVEPAYLAAKIGLTVLFVAVAILGPGLTRGERAMLFRMLGRFVRRPQPAA